MTITQFPMDNQWPDGRPANVAIDGDRISLDFNSVHLIGQIVRFSWHMVLVRLVAPVDLPVKSSREIKFWCPPPEKRFSLFDEGGRELRELSPVGIESAANLVVNIWMAYQAAIEHGELLRKFRGLASTLPPGVHPDLVIRCWDAIEKAEMPIPED